MMLDVILSKKKYCCVIRLYITLFLKCLIITRLMYTTSYYVKEKSKERRKEKKRKKSKGWWRKRGEKTYNKHWVI